MLFQKRIDRAFRLQREQRKADARRPEDDELTPADIMEKGDLPAMIIAALITIIPAALIVLLLLALAGWLFFH